MRRAYFSALDDVDALIAELGEEPGEQDLIEIMDALSTADRVDEAIEWGRSGLERLSNGSFRASRVIDTLAALLKTDGDIAGAIRLYQHEFEQSPSLSNLERLLDSVVHDRDKWLDAAIEQLSDQVAAAPLENRPARGDVLVEILLWAKRPDDAWNSACDAGCSPRRWMELAAERESTRPLDAIDVYEPEVLRLIDVKNNKAYAAAVALMGRIGRLGDAAGVPERFAALVTIARTTHKPKRNLQKLLDQHGW